MAHIVLYIAISQDGFIADKNGSVDWLPQEAPEGEDFGFEKFLASIDVIAQGSRTFLQTISFVESGLVPDLPYDGKHMYVFTREPMQTDRSDVTFVSSIEEFLAIIGKNTRIERVWLLGGAELVASFKAYDLIDECIITVIPKMLHEGIALPKNCFDSMQEVSQKQYSQGIVEKRYVRSDRYYGILIL
ncbi:MAG: dihydrofolate reductase family protein [Candidatus Babeliales bacterium]